MKSALIRGLLVAGLIACGSGRVALAAVDMNGAWHVIAVEATTQYRFDCHLSVTQVGSDLTVEGDCPYVGTSTGTGSVDVDTGVFTTTGLAWGSCLNGLTVSGTTNATSTAFTGTFECVATSSTFHGDVNGSRCGNGVLDPGEACDDGNRLDRDCCSPTCTFDASGTTCTSDAEPCTLDACDGAGTCDHTIQAGLPCASDDNACTDDVCDASGLCQHQPNTAPCDDGNDCTLGDTCAEGTCTGACSPCCDPLGGCVPAPAAGCKEPQPELGVLAYASPSVNQPHTLKWNWRGADATTAAELGDPTTTTSYAVCIYRRIGLTEDLGLVLTAEAPAGAMSGTRRSWSVTPKGRIRFRSGTGNSDGLTEISVAPGTSGQARLLVRGKGGALDFNPISGVLPVTAQLRASNGTCFESHYTGRIRDTVVVFGEPFDPPFSIDFLSRH